MANTNKFLPFANAGGANTLTDDAWAALASRQSGFAQGVAQSAQLNKAWKQTALWAATLGQFTVDYDPSDSDVTDALSVAALESMFLAALRSAVTTTQSPTIPYEGNDTGVTPNAVYVASTIPALPTTLAPGQIYLITKNNTSNTGATNIKFGANAPLLTKTVDGSDLLANDWSAYQPALIYLVNIGGTLTAVVMTLPRLNFPGLLQQDTLATGDIFAYYDISATLHEKTTLGNLASFILTQQANPTPIGTYAAPRVFPSSGTFTPDSTCKAIYWKLWGAGAGGESSTSIPIAGGGGGEYREGVIAVTPGVPISIIIGAGGAAQVAGGDSSIGGFATAKGGQPGSGNTGGAGGTGGIGGNFAIPGQRGGAGVGNSSANSPYYFPGFGGGAYGFANFTFGGVRNGTGFGCGGTAGNNLGGTPTGGTGSGGFCTIQQLTGS